MLLSPLGHPGDSEVEVNLFIPIDDLKSDSATWGEGF